MPTIEIETLLPASVEACFDSALDVGLHCETMTWSGERAVAGKTEGILELGDRVTWEARHLGFRFRMTVEITRFSRPHYFVDEQVSGPFKRLCHRHDFYPVSGGCRMVDAFEYEAPFGVLGRLAERLFLHRYMARLLTRRVDALRQRMAPATF